MASKRRVYFSVVKPRQTLSIKAHSSLVLMQDNWNDYSFRTQYQLFVFNKADYDLIGNVKILRKGQKNTDPLQVTNDFAQLDDKFCSLGQSLDYYCRLSALARSMLIAEFYFHPR